MTIAAVGPLDAPVGLAVFMTVGALVFVPLSTRGALRLWRDRTRIFDETQAWWLWGDPLWRGYVRWLTVAGLTFAFDLVLIAGLLWGPDADATLLVLGIPLLLSMAIAVVLGAGIVLFNRPRAAVPPHLRDQPGALAEWRDGGRRRRSADAAGS